MTTKADQGTVLVAEDDEPLRLMLARAIARLGYATHVVADGNEALDALDADSYDVVLSDIDMPGRNGIELLRAIRERDLDIPVLLLTGAPRMETAIAAVEFGATHYLTKPVDLGKLGETVRRAMQAGRLARARRELVGVVDDALPIGDLAGLSVHFEMALAKLFMHCQPIISWSTRSTYAYEALVRSSEPTVPGPAALFDAADRLNRIVDVGRKVRTILPLDGSPDIGLFVNLHPKDLLDDTLYDRNTTLAAAASRVVLEITERARLETIPDVSRRVTRLREMGFKIAIDDIGAGYAGLTSFAALDPDYMKLDRGLIENIHESRTKMRLVGAMIHACDDLGVKVIGEGVETAAERDALIELGCDLLQGYLFARPQVPFVTPTF
jgi:EAL domain-containing protein (putative c-di-GMP-specific phosphodiesterase class I)